MEIELVLNAAHGGVDYGNPLRGSPEKTRNEIALHHCAQCLNGYNCHVTQCRTGDEFRTPAQRIETIRTIRPALALTCEHCAGSVPGSIFYWHGDRQSCLFAQELARQFLWEELGIYGLYPCEPEGNYDFPLIRDPALAGIPAVLCRCPVAKNDDTSAFLLREGQAIAQACIRFFSLMRQPAGQEDKPVQVCSSAMLCMEDALLLCRLLKQSGYGTFLPMER